jgi:hypothetical protein
MKSIILFLSLILLACTPRISSIIEEGQPLVLEKADWLHGEFKNAPQILLTNSSDIKGYPHMDYLASSFLLQGQKDTFGITARHLLGPGGGFREEISTTQFNKLLLRWIMYPRATEEVNESNSVTIKSLINTRKTKHDILVFKLSEIAESILPLKPYFGRLESGEKLLLIGCSYSEKNCKQNLYIGSYGGFYNSELSVMNISGDFNFRGYSGAPVLNERGYCVGVLFGGRSHKNGQTPLLFSPISQVEKIINK